MDTAPTRYQPVDPADRPRKERQGARVLVRCQGRALLVGDRDPGVAGSGWWKANTSPQSGHSTLGAESLKELYSVP